MRERSRCNQCNYSQVRDEENCQTERRVEAESNETEHPEERLHHKVCQVVEEVECEETPRGTVQPGQEVNNDVEEENSSGGERDICKQVGDCDSRWSIEAVLRLEGKVVSPMFGPV